MNNDGMTALHLTVCYKQLIMNEKLLDSRFFKLRDHDIVNLNAKNKNGIDLYTW